MKVYFSDNPRIKSIALNYLRKYGDGRSEALDDLKQLLMAERDLGMRDVVKNICEFLRMPDEEYDRLHKHATDITHKVADTIELLYLEKDLIAQLVSR